MALKSLTGTLNESVLDEALIVDLDKIHDLQMKLDRLQSSVRERLNVIADKWTKEHANLTVNKRNFYEGKFVDNIYKIEKIDLSVPTKGVFRSDYKVDVDVSVTRVPLKENDTISLCNSFKAKDLYLWPKENEKLPNTESAA